MGNYFWAGRDQFRRPSPFLKWGMEDRGEIGIFARHGTRNISFPRNEIVSSREAISGVADPENTSFSAYFRWNGLRFFGQKWAFSPLFGRNGKTTRGKAFFWKMSYVLFFGRFFQDHLREKSALLQGLFEGFGPGKTAQKQHIGSIIFWV